MSDLESHGDNLSATAGSPESVCSKEITEDRLREVGIRVARSVTVEEGVKATYKTGHPDPSNQTFPGLLDGNYTIHGGDGLVIFDIDIDDLSDLPEWVQNLPDTFTVESPHGGYHLYYAIEDGAGISITTTRWGSIRYDGQYVVGPGSTIDHARCDDGKANCPGEGIGTYDNTVNAPIAPLSGDHLDHLRECCDSDASDLETEVQPIDDPDGDLVARGELTLRTLQSISTPAFTATMDFLQGGIADFDRDRLTKADGRIDRDTQDTIALSLLYGTLRRFGGYDHPTAITIAQATYTHYCQAHDFTDDYQQRRWIVDTEEYRKRIVTYATGSFDSGEFSRLLNRSGESSWRRQQCKYSETSYRLARAVIDICCGDDPDEVQWRYDLDLAALPPLLFKDMTRVGSENSASSEIPASPDSGGSWQAGDCPYPSMGEVAELLASADRNTADSFRNVLRELRRDGNLKMICMKEGVDYRICRPHDPEPADACYITIGGEQREPEPPETVETQTESDEPELMTDGGTQMSAIDARHDLERLRQARDGDDNSGDEAEGPSVYCCPVDGCSRTVVGNPAHLRSHVRQAGDDAHQYRTLTEDLEIETEWSAMNWGPGAPE